MIPTVNPSQPVWMQRKRIGLLFALVLVVLMAGAASSAYETMNLLQANKWVVHTLEVLNALEQTYVEVRDAEAAQRGYVITGDEQFVTAFEQATEKVNAQHPILRASTSDNPTQQQNLQQLETLMTQRVKIAADIIAPRQHEGFDAARAQVAAGAGTQLMSAVDRTINAMKQEETQLLSQRGQAANWAAVRLLVALALPMATTLVLLATVYWLMRRDRIQRAEAAEKFRPVVESCPTGIIMVDRFGRIALMNSETERLFGYRREEVLGQPIEVLVPQRFRPQHPQYLQKYMAQPEARSMGIGRDLYGLRKDGSEFPVEIGLHPTPGKDGMLVLAAIVDITERKQREEELRQYTARLQQSNRELQDFAYVSSHDLQEPLRKIQAFGDRLKSTCSASLPQQGNDCVERMQKAAARMRVLIEDLLKFSRVTSKAMPFAPVNLNEVIDDVLEDLEVRINATGAQISIAKLPIIDADPMQMRQLFQNLIGNALKFERPGVPPAIDIRADRLAGSDALPDSTLCEIIVTDNGIGFDNKYAQRIFDVFQRLHERDQYEGSGIGLSICRKIVERHCGSISAQGCPDEGATFVITLPVHQAAETRLETPSETLEEEMPCPRAEEAFSC